MRELDDDDRAFLKSLEAEPGMFAQMGASLHGPMRGWTMFAFAISFALFALSVFAAWRAAEAASLESLVGWAAIGLWAAIAVGMIKIWFFLRMNHLAVLREMHRISLQLADLRGR